ncbi:Fe-S cluster assembly ATPase SufC [Candidatus Curtissbacteria bacterium]|nr:Fe-S cluster assembly ATPase SufC [Candidatus Curtissbacteria bacterium]
MNDELLLKIQNLRVSVEGKGILKGLDLTIRPGEMHVLMGPNGSGKSTLAQVVMGYPFYTINDGRLTMDEKDLRNLSPDKRAKLGIFLGFQHPVEVPGVSVFNVLRRAKQSILGQTRGSTPKARAPSVVSGVEPLNKLSKFREELLEYASSLKLSDDFISRSLNEGFSGGEKKRNEILQMMALKPKLVILDEIDSGLDVDGLKLVATSIIRFIKVNPRSSIILITHYARILKYLKPDFVHVMVDGKIVKSGKAKLAQEIEQKGYQSVVSNPDSQSYSKPGLEYVGE